MSGGDRFLALAARRTLLPDPDDAFGRRILAEYGAVFVTTATAPPRPVFRSAAEVERFQASVERAEADLGDVRVALQRPALDQLLAAADEARQLGLEVAPRGADAAVRSWGDSETLWRGRVERACDHWVAEGRLEPERAHQLRRLDAIDQVPVVLNLECEGVWFSTFFDKSILRSVAAPGTSQHLSMLAFDVADFANPEVRRLLPRHGWFQTVVSDLPHFTYLGRSEAELPSLGLRPTTLDVDDQTYEFWVPDLG